MHYVFYTDESGDLGWSFDRPYGKGGSSRYLVIAAMSLPVAEAHRPERVMKDLFKAHGAGIAGRRNGQACEGGLRP